MSGARETDSQRQVRQMVNFIMQEANEKVNELRIKTDHDFNLEKQQLVHNGKLKVQEEYAQKQKDLEVQQRVSKATAVATSKVKRMTSRDELLEKIKAAATAKLAQFTKSPDYAKFLRQLIVQGLIKIEEPVVEIQARSEDKAIVSRLLPDAIAEFRSIMSSAGHSVNPQVTVSELTLSSKNTVGGVVLTALNGKIVLNQTMDERLQIAYTDKMPDVRLGLFPSQNKVKRNK